MKLGHERMQDHVKNLNEGQENQEENRKEPSQVIPTSLQGKQ
jgi:hypothetical protein